MRDFVLSLPRGARLELLSDPKIKTRPCVLPISFDLLYYIIRQKRGQTPDVLWFQTGFSIPSNKDMGLVLETSILAGNLEKLRPIFTYLLIFFLIL